MPGSPRFLPTFLAGVLFSLPVFGADSPPAKVIIIQRAPIELLDATGAVTGVRESVTGESFTLVSADGIHLTLRDAQGALFRVNQGETDYSPPPSTQASTSTSVSPSPPATATPPPAATTLASTPSAPASNDKVTAIDTGLGLPLFAAQDFWKESASLIASRLNLQLEDKTKWESAYRRYFYNEQYTNYAPASLLGGKAYCIALYADAGDAPTSVLIAFTNDGDYQGVVLLTQQVFELTHSASPDGKKLASIQAQVAAMEQAFETDRRNEAATIQKNLTSLFGDPHPTAFGSSATTREDALRWDWNGVSFLLTGQENKYNLLRIIPTALADNHGRTERIPRDEMGAKLSSAVEHRPNGDIVITQIPMADQGLKGYCVPATWERVLRYTGVPGDMYTLSRIGGSAFGGGEWGGSVASQLDDTLHDYGRRAEFLIIDRIDAISLHRYIDAGIPIFWAVNPRGYEAAEQRYRAGDRDKNFDQWKQLLSQARTASTDHQPPLPKDEGHQVLITGYNPDTREIAWSDPWGRQTQERWMTQEEAQRCSLGEYYIITW